MRRKRAVLEIHSSEETDCRINKSTELCHIKKPLQPSCVTRIVCNMFPTLFIARLKSPFACRILPKQKHFLQGQTQLSSLIRFFSSLYLRQSCCEVVAFNIKMTEILCAADKCDVDVHETFRLLMSELLGLYLKTRLFNGLKDDS